MKKYIDFDNVILATQDLLFQEYDLLKNQGIEIDRKKYVQEYDWHKLLPKCEIIGDAIEFLNSMNDDCILTRVYSMENEGVAKINFLRDIGIKNDIILAPYLVKKSDVVCASGNVLVDDSVANLNDWYEKGGISVFFNKDNYDIDRKGIKNPGYVKIKTLGELKSIKFNK